MNALAEDKSKVLALLTYQCEITGNLDVFVTQNDLDKFLITEQDFRIALNFIIATSDLEIIQEHIFGDVPTGENWQFQFFRIRLPKNFLEIFSNKRRVSPKSEYTNIAKAIKKIGSLELYDDRTLRSQGIILDIRPQLVDICEALMEYPDTTLNLDDIKDALGHTKPMSDKIITKYISELRRDLEKKTGLNYVSKKKNGGWIISSNS